MSLLHKLTILILLILIILVLKFNFFTKDENVDEEGEGKYESILDNDCPDGFTGEFCTEEIWPIAYEYEFDKNYLLDSKKYSDFKTAFKKCDNDN